MMAKIKIGSLPDHEITGTISRIALQSDKENTNSGIHPSSSSSSSSSSNSPFNVGFRIEITNLQLPKDLVLRSGYSATASIDIKKVNNALVLPLRVIHFKDTKPYVLLPAKKDDKPKEQPIELGISDSINIEIKSGLKFGDKVVDQPDVTVVNQR
jgi:HlyD family secretion protein